MADRVLAGVDASFVPVRAGCIYTVEMDGEAVLLDESVNRLHLLNSTATLVWGLLDGGVSVGEVARELSEELVTPYDTVLADTLAVIRAFNEQGLLAGVAAPR
jgi:hypothetical protein